MAYPLLRPTADRRRCLLQLTCRAQVLYFPFLNKVSTMDDFNNFSCHDGYSYSPSYCAPVADHYTESYNYCTTDPIAIMLRQQREDDEQRMLDAAQRRPEAEPVQAWTSTTRAYESYSPRVSTHVSSPVELSPAWWAEVARQRADDPDAPHEALAARAAGEKYYCLPSEPASWRRPLGSPGGYDVQWWMMFHDADERSMVLAELLGYTGARDADGWIRPTLWELLKMGYWTAQRYAFYYAEFADEYGRKIPPWIALLRSRQAHTPSAVMFG